MPREDFSGQLRFFKSFKRRTLSKPFANPAERPRWLPSGSGCHWRKAPSCMCHSHFPYPPGWKKRSHPPLVLHSCSSYFFLPHNWNSTGLDPLSLERQNAALPALPGRPRFPSSTGICSPREHRCH